MNKFVFENPAFSSLAEVNHLRRIQALPDVALLTFFGIQPTLKNWSRKNASVSQVAGSIRGLSPVFEALLTPFSGTDMTNVLPGALMTAIAIVASADRESPSGPLRETDLATRLSMAERLKYIENSGPNKVSYLGYGGNNRVKGFEGDAWKFRGATYVQITGRTAFMETVGEIADSVKDPSFPQKPFSQWSSGDVDRFVRNPTYAGLSSIKFVASRFKGVNGMELTQVIANQKLSVAAQREICRLVYRVIRSKTPSVLNEYLQTCGRNAELLVQPFIRSASSL